MSGRKLQEHIRLSGARLVQQRWDVKVRKDKNDNVNEIPEALRPVTRIAKNAGRTQNVHEHVKNTVDQSKNVQR